jgi:CRP-like cAMP-binding protein
MDMPATERLLDKLKETLGEGPTRDLVGWVNEAQTVNRSEIRELADVYLGRFDERLERRLVQTDAKLERRLVQMDAKLEQRLAEQDTKLEQRLADQDTKLERRLADQDTKLERRLTEMTDRVSAQYRDLLRWLFVFWAGTLIPLAGLMIAVVKL